MTKQQGMVAFTRGLGLGAALCLVVLVGLAADSGRDQNVTEVRSEGVSVDNNTTDYRTAEAPFDGGENFNLDNVTEAKCVKCGGYATVSLGGTFSAGDATVSVTAHLFYRNPSTGAFEYRHSETMTMRAMTAATGDTVSSGRYPITQTFDVHTRGANRVLFTFRDPSSGTFTPTAVTVW